jgi:uncharacterized membrane protein YdbT with pleckstrin-like domain
MDQLTIFLKARGQFFKLLLGALVIAGAIYALNNYPKQISKKIHKKSVVIKMTYLPDIIEGIAAASLLYMIYIVLITKTTKLEVGRVNFVFTHGIFDRKKDALDITGIQDFTQEQNLFDMVLGVSTFTIISKDKTNPNLVLRGIGKSDGLALFEHINVYSNKNIVKYVQSQSDRENYRKKFHPNSESEIQQDSDSDKYVKTRAAQVDEEDDN